MAGVTIQIVKDEASPALLQLALDLNSRALMGALGKRAEGVLRKHFREKGQIPEKHGWPSQHFWDRRIRNATALSSFDGHQATVTISDPAFAAKVFGATVTPKEKQYLAIPLQAAAYGKQPSSGLIRDLFVLRTKKGLFLASRSEQGAIAKLKSATTGALYLFYRLVKRATLPKDPTALPPESTMQEALNDETEKFIARRLG